MENEEILKELRKPFAFTHWKIQMFSKDKQSCFCIPYIKHEQITQRLNDVLGLGKWQFAYRKESGVSIGTLSLLIGDEWLSFEDVGYSEQSHKDEKMRDKGDRTDAMKRCARNIGIGEYLLDLGQKKLKYDQTKKRALTDNGDVLWTPDALSIYCNGISTSIGLLSQIWKINAKLHDNETFKLAMGDLKKLLS